MEIASLWFDVDAPAVAPPTVSREQVLPLGSLSWENFERLCFRLAHRGGDVENARIYGERGQAQEGIDLYVRRATGDYATWQCKRYQEIKATDIKNAVMKFLEGDWAGRTKLVKSTIFGEHTSISALYQVYGSDPEIRPLLDSTMHVLHKDLRVEFARAIEPLVRRSVPAAVAIVAEFRNEPNGEARTVAARAYARARIREGSKVQDLIEALRSDLTGFNLGRDQRQQAAAAALLELGRADFLAMQREDGQLLQFSTYSNARHNWEFVATVVEYWESLAEAVPDIWERFNHSPIIATELAKADKSAHALSQAQMFENAVHTGEQLQVEQVKALIALHGHSALLRDLFLGRLQFMARQKSMMVLERAAYAAMASYLTENFRSDEAVGQVMLSLATSSLIHDAAFIALCQGWPDAPRSLRPRGSCQRSSWGPNPSPLGCSRPKRTPPLWQGIS